MNLEKIVMELFSRIKELEEKVETIEITVENLKTIPRIINEEAETTEKITRKVSRQYVIEKLKKCNPQFFVMKGNRASGADIILNIKEKEIGYTLKAKFYHSKSYEDYVSGWHTVNSEDLVNEDIHFFIFTVEFEKKYYTFLFTRTELLAYIQSKSKDQQNSYHFYFRIKDNKFVEVRDGERDVAKYYEKWALPSTFIKKINK